VSIRHNLLAQTLSIQTQCQDLARLHSCVPFLLIAPDPLPRDGHGALPLVCARRLCRMLTPSSSTRFCATASSRDENRTRHRSAAGGKKCGEEKKPSQASFTSRNARIFRLDVPYTSARVGSCQCSVDRTLSSDENRTRHRSVALAGNSQEAKSAERRKSLRKLDLTSSSLSSLLFPSLSIQTQSQDLARLHSCVPFLPIALLCNCVIAR
jgi:hypothetical protein